MHAEESVLNDSSQQATDDKSDRVESVRVSPAYRSAGDGENGNPMLDLPARGGWRREIDSHRHDFIVPESSKTLLENQPIARSKILRRNISRKSLDET